MHGSLALVGSGEYLPAMASLEKSLVDDGIKNGKRPIYIQIPPVARTSSGPAVRRAGLLFCYYSE
jgi:hypothetical protein